MKTHCDICGEPVPEWLDQFMLFMNEAAHVEMSPAEMATLIHQGLLLVEAQKYAEPDSCFAFTLSGATEADVDQIRRQLSPFENRIVKIEARPNEFRSAQTR